MRARHELLAGALTAILALYRALAGIAVLWRGYVLLAVPAAPARAAISVCLAGGIALAVQTVSAGELTGIRSERRSAGA